MSAPRKSKTFGGGAIPKGTPSMDLNIYDQTFKVRGSMSGIRILRIMSALDGEQKEGEDSTTDAIIGFLSDAFLTEDRARGMDFLEHADPPVDLPLLTEIIQWLVEQYTGNPTEQPEPSAITSNPSGSTSSESVSPPVPAPTSAILTDTNYGQSQPLSQPVPS